MLDGAEFVVTDQQFDIIVGLLTDIRDGLVIVASDVSDDGCSHPEEQRVSLSSFGDLDHWVCRLCRFDNKAGPPPMN